MLITIFELCSLFFFMIIFRIVHLIPVWLGALLLLSSIPGVAGLNENPFPDIPFQEFSDFVTSNFSSTISLSSVLVILLSLTENVQLLSLHGRQQKKRYTEERSTTATAWIRVLAQSLRQKLESDEVPMLS